MSEKHVSLFYQQGSSDKEYHIFLRKKGSGYVVDIQYGRRGNSLTCSTKTPSPVDLDKATAIFDSQVHAKKLKGYSEAAGQAPYVGSDKEDKITGILPQLLNNVEEEQLESLFKDDTYCLQEKKDGKRILIRKQDGSVEAINRKGLLVGFPAGISTALSQLPGSFLLDGELIGETIWFFDVLEYAGTDFRKTPYGQRYQILCTTLAALDGEGSCVRVVDAIFGTPEKRKAFKELKALGVEGVVFKNVHSLYKAGRPASGGDMLKFKFTQTCTVQVSGLNEKGKRSVYVQALDGKELVDVGKVTVLPNFEVPKIGTLVEVEYLYRHVHGALYQPVFLGVRDDLDGPDQVKTLKIKEGVEVDEDES